MKVFWTGRCLHSVIDVFLILNFDDQFCHDESQLDFKRVKVSQTWLDVFLKFKFSFFFSFLQVDWHNRYKWMQRIPRARWEGYTFKSQWFIHLLPLYTSCSKNIILVNYYVEYFFFCAEWETHRNCHIRLLPYIHRRPWMFQPRLYYSKFAHSPIL